MCRCCIQRLRACCGRLRALSPFSTCGLLLLMAACGAHFGGREHEDVGPVRARGVIRRSKTLSFWAWNPSESVAIAFILHVVALLRCMVVFPIGRVCRILTGLCLLGSPHRFFRLVLSAGLKGLPNRECSMVVLIACGHVFFCCRLEAQSVARMQSIFQNVELYVCTPCFDFGDRRSIQGDFDLVVVGKCASSDLCQPCPRR